MNSINSSYLVRQGIVTITIDNRYNRYNRDSRDYRDNRDNRDNRHS